MLSVFVVRTLTWCSQILEMWSIHTGEQISNSKNPNGKDCVTLHRTTTYHCCHSLHAFTGSCEKFSFLTYDSWSALPWKHKPRQNSIRTFLKTPVVFSGFSLLSLERSSLAVFAAVQDVVHLVFHVSIKWGAALLVHHVVVRQRLIELAFRWFFCQCRLITQYTLDPGLVNLFFYTLSEPNNYIKRAFPFFSSSSAVRPTQFFGIITKKGEKERKKEKRQGLTFLTLINSLNWKMSIIKIFPGIRGLVVYPFFYEVDHYIFCHVEFVSIWWLSCLERLAYLLARPFFIAPYLEAPATQLCLVVFKLHQREPTFLFVNCTWKLNER